MTNGVGSGGLNGEDRDTGATARGGDRMPSSAQASTASHVHRKCGLALCDCPYEWRDSTGGSGSASDAAADPAAAAAAASLSSSSSRFAHTELAESLLQERATLRLARDWARADTILTRLESMGVVVDDKERSWSVSAAATAGAATATDAPRQQQKRARESEPASGPTAASSSSSGGGSSSSGGIPCKMCGQIFPSRNLVFKHLRDGGASGCGASVAQQGGIAPSPNEAAKAAARPARRASRQRPGQTARHASAESCLWLGDLPLPWTRTAGKHRRLTALLYQHTPRGVPQPWLKKVVRKGYRDKASGAYLGYAIVAFRDKAEAQAVLPAMHGLKISAEVTFVPNDLTHPARQPASQPEPATPS